jgi:predicted branched-subunit amino acid permease
MGILLYGMFIAIIVPPAKKEKGILFAVILAAVCAMVFRYLLPFVSSGFAIIISAIVSSIVCATLFPVPEDEKEELVG